jgi:hypothetical protein
LRLLAKTRTSPGGEQDFSPISKETLPSAVGYNYTKLKNLLANGKWKEADAETAHAILKVSGREKEGNLRLEDAAEIPLEDLQTIDQLWLRYSNEHFGFSVRKEIYQNLKNTVFTGEESWEKLGNAVGSLVQKNAP